MLSFRSATPVLPKLTHTILNRGISNSYSKRSFVVSTPSFQFFSSTFRTTFRPYAISATNRMHVRPVFPRSPSSISICLSSLFPRSSTRVFQKPIRFLSTSTATSTTAVGTENSPELTLSTSSTAVSPSPPTDVLQSIDTLSSTAAPVLDGPLPNYDSGIFTHSIHVLLDFVHSTTGLPWWGSIVVLTVAFRVVLLTLAIPQQRNMANLKLASPALQALQAEMAAQKTSDEGLTPAYATEHRRKIRDLFLAYNCNPLKSMIMPLVLIPIFLTFFYAIPTMQLYRPSFHTGGFPPVLDLALPDPTFILPTINFLFMIIPMELGAIQAESGGAMTPSHAAFMRNIFRVIAVASLFVIQSFPAGMLIYWITTNIWTTLQFLAFRNEKIKKLLNIPSTNNEKKKFNYPIFDDIAWVLDKLGIKRNTKNTAITAFDTTTPVISIKDKIAADNARVPRVNQNITIIKPQLSNAKPPKKKQNA